MENFDIHIPRANTTLRQQAIDHLRKAILYGHFEPAEKLREKKLSESLGISRALLREVLQYLQAEGLITNIPHKGPMVATIDANDAREIYQVRQRLEALVGEGFTINATDQQVYSLREALGNLHACKASTNAQTLLEAKNNFYEILLEGCGNRVVAEILNLLNNRVTLLRRRSLKQPGRLSKSLRELEAIVTAIEARDIISAGELCATHVANAAEAVAHSFLESQ